MTSSKSKTEYYQQLLSVLFEFMMRNGIPRAAVERVVVRAIQDAETAASQLSIKRQDTLSARRVLGTWHRTRMYVDDHANPKAIPLTGRAPSVAALIRAERVKENPALLIRRWKALGIVVRCGSNRYKPTGDVLVIPKLDAYLQEHLARSLSMLLKTVKLNLSVTENSQGLVERTADVPDLPVKYVPQFRAFAKSQASAFLQRIDDWLESRRLRRARGRRQPSVAAGMHVFAFLDRQDGRRGSRRKEKNRSERD